MITTEQLKAEKARLDKRQEQLVADLNGVIGALQEVEILLKLSEAQPDPEKKP